MNLSLNDIEGLDTPIYAYDMGLLRRTLDQIRRSLQSRPNFHVHYAVKANNNPQIVSEIIGYGCLGADCVSGGELRHVIALGARPDDVVYSGVGKTDAELRLGIESGIGCFNVESAEELLTINEIALSMGKKARVALRINPDIDAHTHPNITTGTYEDQFGIPKVQIPELMEEALKMKSVHLRGLHFHIGSQITEMTAFAQLVEEVNKTLDFWEARGLKFEWINVGGGLGIDYDNPDASPIPDFESYFSTFDAIHLRPDQKLHFELGRSVVAQCGSLVTKVLYIKEGVNKNFAIVDAGFTDLIRPALYDAHHAIDVLTQTSDRGMSRYDVVGPVCESTDCFARGEILPELRRGDVLAFRSAGAYGESMASTYNMRALPGNLFYNNE